MFKEHASQPVTYTRGDLSVQLLASKGRTVSLVQDGTIAQEVVTEDFIFSTVDLVLNGRGSLPEPGDRIKRIVGDKVVTYEVAQQGDSKPYSYVDEVTRERIRAHTVIVGEA
jgi:hypothetical protein